MHRPAENAMHRPAESGHASPGENSHGAEPIKARRSVSLATVFGPRACAIRLRTA